MNAISWTSNSESLTFRLSGAPFLPVRLEPVAMCLHLKMADIAKKQIATIKQFLGTLYQNLCARKIYIIGTINKPTFKDVEDFK